MKYIHLLALLLLLGACKKERISLLVTELQTPTTADVHDIYFSDGMHGRAVGGTRWEHGETMQTSDGGQTWTADTIANNELNSISQPGNGQDYIVGFRGYYLNKNENTDNIWRFKELEVNEALQSVAFYDENLGIAVGGGSFHTGIIFRFDNSAGVRDSLFYPIEHELADVVFIDRNTIITVGYGLVLKSTDAGKSWEPRRIDGDFFKAVHFPSPEVGYAVGFTGTIIKTTDGGDTWSKLRNANRLSTTKKEMTDVYFLDQERGYIVGKNGLFWKTDDGGESWKTVEMVDVHLNAITVLEDGTGFIAADGGRVYKFVD